ncbi:MAG: hypothetical protein A2W90_06865 [Bacteroidetes bacterium GWF2_42_66]|nr:MAG: hypothetical protein A2W92_01795 [Bacteroidetes bacterium GWA2_42_15]OFY02873.1 MAG: hypothetical protein A2W89_24270 [Bacteroidetes bacterium GWE2_42_39]OFY44528.1 MAG: hypothetical protein A2W90_06865 [Bacteroidetes bacterium GWF2_42_66]HAZ04624.1 hypothetical protein [Marinilabiliales bacterium]HBL74925.1 hypothetical protein [Prolixibacteraceae bacterium]
MPGMGSRTAVAFDPSFIHNSGKKTPGIGYFWLGCAGRALRGIEILGLSVIDADTRVQIEFGFRDAKQFAGLKNSQARSGNKINFHFNTALTTVNIAKIMQLSNPETRVNSFSMATH